MFSFGSLAKNRDCERAPVFKTEDFAILARYKRNRQSAMHRETPGIERSR
ncbi:hypothetical protein RE6C_02728 [Rhodopirellula europaea 6C]|uniref:Uncharacterized protein n=1 Tax=Rhodopirellula europaea 6C TaxID=1263867 RepID=M2B3M4_9BACT|nr:hypothetical protein RE6C_02728 [Rhodopirellula europaea 6C]